MTGGTRLKDLSEAQIRDLDWYYQVELRPGVTTKGHAFPNVIATRAVLERVTLDGADLLDVGAMEGHFSVLASRAGARVVAYDRLRREDRVALVKEAFGVSFDYHCGQSFHDFATGWKGGRFDIILCSGVLYHVIEPMLFLHYLRCLLKPGGVLVLETSLALSEDAALYFNEKARFYGATNFYQASSGWLDCTLRYLGFRIVEVESVASAQMGGHMVPRVALAAIYDGSPVLEDDDRWGGKRYLDPELAEYMKPEAAPPSDGIRRHRPSNYAPEVWRAATRSLNLTAVLRSKPALPVDRARCVTRLDQRLGSS